MHNGEVISRMVKRENAIALLDSYEKLPRTKKNSEAIKKLLKVLKEEIEKEKKEKAGSEQLYSLIKTHGTLVDACIHLIVVAMGVLDQYSIGEMTTLRKIFTTELRVALHMAKQAVNEATEEDVLYEQEFEVWMKTLF